MKTFLIVLAAIILVGGAGFVVVSNRDSGQDSAAEETTEQQPAEDNSESQASEESSDNPDPNGYTQGANIGDTVDATGQSEVSVSIDDLVFETTFLKIKKGTKVTWVNNGSLSHDVTSSSSSPKGGLGSDLLGSGATYEFTFDEAGVYEYFCTPHSTQMKGVITVID